MKDQKARERRILASLCILLAQVYPSSPVLKVGQPLHLPDKPRLVLFPLTAVNLTSLQQMAAPVFINLSCVLTGQREAVRVRAAPGSSSFGKHSLSLARDGTTGIYLPKNSRALKGAKPLFESLAASLKRPNYSSP